MHLWLFEALNAYRILNLSHGHIPAPWRDLWQSPTLNISLNYDFFVNVLNIGWHRDTNYQLLQIVQTWMEDGFLWMFLDTTPALRGISPLSKSLGYVWEKVSSMLCSQKMLLWRCLKNTKPYNISIWEAGADWGWLHGRPQKMVRGSAKCKSKGVPWNTNIASNVWILHLSFSFLRTT